jgi:uncharacterized protein (TIGR02001 family)
MFKKAMIAGAITGALFAHGAVFAADAPAPAADAKPADAKPEEPKAPYTLTGNFGIFSQYIFRGLSQTGRKPAAQGGFDFAHESGFYAGTWLSNISWLKEGASTAAATSGIYGEGGSLEWDVYGGYKWNLPNDFVVDLGTLYYYYPGSINPGYRATLAPLPGGINTNVPKADTWEVYIAPSWKWVTFKASYSVLDHTFGVDQSRGTYYLDLSANPPIGDTGFTANLHVGYQKYKGTDPRNGLLAAPTPSNDTIDSYKDVKIGVTYALPKDFSVGAFYSKAFSYNKLAYGGVSDTPVGPYPNDIGKSTGTVFIQKTF